MPRAPRAQRKSRPRARAIVTETEIASSGVLRNLHQKRFALTKHHSAKLLRIPAQIVAGHAPPFAVLLSDLTGSPWDCN
jgi:hypothetical protein